MWISNHFAWQVQSFACYIYNKGDSICFLAPDQAEESPPEETLASFPLSKTLSGSHDEDALFKERLRNMGKSRYFGVAEWVITYKLNFLSLFSAVMLVAQSV